MNRVHRLINVIPGVALALSIVLLLAHLRDADVFEKWSLQQQVVNRALLNGIRSVKPSVLQARSVLVVGLVPLFHPWVHPDFLRIDLGYRGRWTAAVDDSDKMTPYVPPPPISNVTYSHIDLAKYDLIVIFSSEGKLIVAATSATIRAAKPIAHKMSDGEALREILSGQITIHGRSLID